MAATRLRSSPSTCRATTISNTPRLGLEQTAFREYISRLDASTRFRLTDERSVAKQGTPSQGYERATWPELEKLARDVPEAGIHFQGKRARKLWLARYIADG